MNLEVNTQILCELGLSISEYVYLLNLFNDERDPNLYKFIDYVDEPKLQTAGYIKIQTNGSILRQKGTDIFKRDDLFLKFITMYPIRSPNGRYLSPAGTTGKLYNEALARWNSVFKNSTAKKELALKILEAELEWRRKENNLNFMPECKPWMSSYEKYSYLLDDAEDQNKSHLNDLM